MTETFQAIHLVQGEHQISDRTDVVLTTILGSCVAACIFDPIRGIGGMNHFLLPESANDHADIRYAAAAMEVLINALLRHGAQRPNMQAKIFGGARMTPNLPDIGRQNAVVAKRILQNDGIKLVSGDICGNEARRIRFWPTTGRVQMVLLGNTAPPRPEQPVRPTIGGIELF